MPGCPPPSDHDLLARGMKTASKCLSLRVPPMMIMVLSLNVIVEVREESWLK